ncbi:MAG: NADH-quinone oxidoreductase subunit NuoN [candidate division Zixibacteria bacterium]|nr:NADH-quinone oxidoreductase subunit NuoN [candidate division Zixibacteria bacterium]
MPFDIVQFYADWQTILPECFLLVWACIVTMAAVFSRNSGEGTSTGTYAIWTLIGVLVTAVWVALTPDGTAFGGTFVFDRLAVLFKEIVLGGVLLTVISSIGPVDRMKLHRGEFFGLLLFSAVGMMLMVSATELLLLYIAIELSTVTLFVLAAYRKANRKSAEAGLKYVILGGISSAVLLYGVALLYGMTGSTELAGIRNGIGDLFMASGSFPPGLTMALLLLLAGFGFKLALAPFHMWAPDVYEGAPTPITAYLSVASKAAAVAAFLRVFFVGLESSQTLWVQAVAVLAALAMIVGNVTAIVQSNIKRMLAYSSVAQIGYILVGAVAVNTWGATSMTYYAMAYLFANMGAFICVIAFSNRMGSDEIDDYAALSRRSPTIAVFFSIFLLSLAGIPPTAGFLAKYYVFLAAINNGYLWLVIVGLLTSVIALYYYATVIRKMFFPLDQPEGGFPVSLPLTIALSISCLGVLLLGVFPGPFVDLAQAAAAMLMPGM